MPRNRLNAAADSAGCSDFSIYEFSTRGEDLGGFRSILDLGCGAGHFGLWLTERRSQGVLDGLDLLRHSGFATSAYRDFSEADLDSDFSCHTDVRYDAIFAHEVIQSLENPRAFLRSAAALLAPRGILIFTAPNPSCIANLLLIATKGNSRNFLDGNARYPSQISPLLPMDAGRIAKEAGLELRSVDYSNRSRLRGGLCFQDLFPFLTGRLFSDHYRVVAKRIK